MAVKRISRRSVNTGAKLDVENGESLRFSASLIQQGAKQFYSATIPTDILARCCFVTTRDEDPVTGFQRVLDKKRAQDIANYIDEEHGTIPGSIILSAQPDAQLKLIGGGKTIEFTFTGKSFLVLDGQHRIYGFSLAESAFRVPVVIYSELTPTEEARLFIDINTKQRQVPNELLLDIKKLADRETEKDQLLRETFDLFSTMSKSALLGLMSPSSRKKDKISRVTFNLAFKPVISVFGAPTANQVFTVTNSYLLAFVDVLKDIQLEEKIISPVVFRAVMDLFPEVARISAAQSGKEFTKGGFTAILSPISQQLSVSKIEKNGKAVKDLSAMFSRFIKKDFSI
ncbi:DGQHR domain-containing protein [Pseudomonas cichorii]|nr:DGQHR domain-containing protein [Pseudomonas cichorii]MBX8538036.1 DGQHR domain-containing protein [Pseudomonas cichorii]